MRINDLLGISKIHEIAFASIICISCIHTTKLHAHDIAVENEDGITIYYNYINDGQELEVTYCDDVYYVYDNIECLRIPSQVTISGKSLNVTGIGDQAFTYCIYLDSVVLPNTVKNIGVGAFYRCGVKSLVLPNSLENIDFDAFLNCRLEDIYMPNRPVVIKSHAFMGCGALKKVFVHDLETWCNSDFWTNDSNPLLYAKHLYNNDNTEITDIVIPNSVTNIKAGTFAGGAYITSVTIPNSVISIESDAFDDCCSITSLTIPNSVTTIGNSAFYNCRSITTLSLPNSIISIGNFSFCGCQGLNSIRLPNSLSSIGFNAFDNIDLKAVYSMIEEPFGLYSGTFNDYTLKNATLYVPIGTIGIYKATEGWQDFAFIEEHTNTGIGIKTTRQDINTIYYTHDGKLTKEPIKGINIIKQSNGTIKKFVKNHF